MTKSMAYKTSLVFLALLSAVVTFAVPSFAQSEQEPLTPEIVDVISRNCAVAQSSIQRVQHSDVVVRTNRGRSYESVLNLMASLNSRIAINKVSQPRMVEIAGLLQTRFGQFYDNYTAYDASIDRLLRLKCATQPEQFYRELTDIRAKRAIVSADVQAMDALIQEYDQLIIQMRTELNPNNQEPLN